MNKFDRFELIEIFEIYKNLLTKKQISYFIDYYFNDYSLNELAIKNKISKNGVLDFLKKTEKKLYFYEDNLKIFQKNKELENIINLSNKEEIINKLKELKEIK